MTGGTDRSIEQSEMLISGKFNNCVEKTEFWDNAVASIEKALGIYRLIRKQYYNF